MWLSYRWYDWSLFTQKKRTNRKHECLWSPWTLMPIQSCARRIKLRGVYGANFTRMVFSWDDDKQAFNRRKTNANCKKATVNRIKSKGTNRMATEEERPFGQAHIILFGWEMVALPFDRFYTFRIVCFRPATANSLKRQKCSFHAFP